MASNGECMEGSREDMNEACIHDAYVIADATLEMILCPPLKVYREEREQAKRKWLDCVRSKEKASAAFLERFVKLLRADLNIGDALLAELDTARRKLAEVVEVERRRRIAEMTPEERTSLGIFGKGMD